MLKYINMKKTELKQLIREELKSLRDQQNNYKYVIVTGYFHPEIGDDYPFTRGFKIPSNKTIEQFKKHFETVLNKKSRVPDDFIVKEVTKSIWEKQFK